MISELDSLLYVLSLCYMDNFRNKKYHMVRINKGATIKSSIHLCGTKGEKGVC